MSSPKPTATEPKAQNRKPGAGAATVDAFLGGRVRLIQPREGHRAGSDAVWLQGAVTARPGEHVLDAGAGVGAAGLCLLARVPGIAVTAVEIDAGLCATARENATQNGCADQFTVIEADLTAPQKTLRSKGLVPEGYDQVMANPPYHEEGKVRPAPHAGKASAHVMGAGELDAWLRFLAAMTSAKGRLTLIYRPESLKELLPLLEGRFGAVAIFPLFPKQGEAASRIIVQARKGSRAGIRLLQGLALHEPGGAYTEAAEVVLRHGAALDLGV